MNPLRSAYVTLTDALYAVAVFAVVATLCVVGCGLISGCDGPSRPNARPGSALHHGFGWKAPAKPADPAKTSYKLCHQVRLANPPAVDLRPKDSPIENQGQLGSCTSFGWAGALRFRDRNRAGLESSGKLPLWLRILIALNLGKAPPPAAAADFPISHLFIYWNERALEGTTGSDSGASVGTGGKVVSTLGYPKEDLWPYEVGHFRTKPPQAAYDDAKGRLVTPPPASIDNTDLDEVRTALANGHPIVFGFDVAQSFDNVGSDGVYNPRGWAVGGHCVTAVGYDDARKRIICRNSWGTDWGDKGYFYGPYSWFASRAVSDAWTIPDAAPAPAPTPPVKPASPLVLILATACVTAAVVLLIVRYAPQKKAA